MRRPLERDHSGFNVMVMGVSVWIPSFKVLKYSSCQSSCMELFKKLKSKTEKGIENGADLSKKGIENGADLRSWSHN